VFVGPEPFVVRHVVRAVSRLNGAFASPEIDVSGAPLELSEPAVAAGVLRQVRGRNEPDGTVSLRLLSLALSPLGAPQWLDLASGLPDSARTLVLHPLSDGRMVLLWRGNFASARTGTEPLAGVVIGTDGQLRRSAAPTLAAERLANVPAEFRFDGVRGRRLWFGRDLRGTLLPNEVLNSSYVEYLALDVDTSAPLAGQGVQRVRLRAGDLLGPVSAAGAVGAQFERPLLLDDRLLWLYGQGSLGSQRLLTQVVHLPPGSAPLP
jgi:hypothetical protein